MATASIVAAERRCHPGPQAAQFSLAALRDQLIKIGAKIGRHGRSITFQMAEVIVPRHLFQRILPAIADLQPRPAVRYLYYRRRAAFSCMATEPKARDFSNCGAEELALACPRQALGCRAAQKLLGCRQMRLSRSSIGESPIVRGLTHLDRSATRRNRITHEAARFHHEQRLSPQHR
jgi:hypothetical protein